ncbi:hypothetical protein AMS68_001737 [Peltaster fructicola]|uniref:Peptidase M20 dimerisation domain-containing protein n=1 Tax=Peltaster fructicola TaxID=286661 RepID=A0A6H0XP05_9PEZI|nr:hypothetical protein AMS68_001737 [Peltaster fructicola]
MAASMSFNDIFERYRPDLSQYEDLYKRFHQNAEISTLEAETSSIIEEHLRKLSDGALDIRTKIGGYGLIGICENGSGPTVLIRADMDAMAVEEKTGLPYASKKTQKDNTDATETLLAARDSWAGTLIALFQPAEERGSGAESMVDDGLFNSQRHACPIPDICMAQHVYPILAGRVLTKSGPFFSAADSYRITIYGRGGHGSMPHKCIDPVVVASHIIIRLQTIVSREVPPNETVVITVGSVQSGNTVNVIGDEAILQVNVRTVSQKWRETVLSSIKRVVDAECQASRCPKPAKYERLNEYPLTENDSEGIRRIRESFDHYFGDSHQAVDQAFLASEDFSRLATAVNKPYIYWVFGGVAEDEWQEREKDGTLDELPVNHSPYFKPAIQPTLQTGMDALVVGAMTWLGKDIQQEKV